MAARLMAGWVHGAGRADLILWAARIPARSEFPGLVRRLISQTNDQVVRLDMPNQEGVGLPGYDGVVDSRRGTPFVPEGLSVWELGVGDDARAKANKDYKTRTEDSLGIDKRSTTFVFVTPREFVGKRDWEDAKRAEGEWRDVRVLDVDDIDLAFECRRP